MASHPSDCPQHPCIGYGWGESSIFAWSTADLVTLYTFTEGGRPVNCQQNCLAINSAEPGYYTIKTAVTLAATFPDYPHITNSYTLEGVFYLKLIAPFLNGNQPTN